MLQTLAGFVKPCFIWWFLTHQLSQTLTKFFFLPKTRIFWNGPQESRQSRFPFLTRPKFGHKLLDKSIFRADCGAKWKVIWLTIHPEGNMNICTEVHDNRSHCYLDISLKNTNVNLMVVPQGVSGSQKSVGNMNVLNIMSIHSVGLTDRPTFPSRAASIMWIII